MSADDDTDKTYGMTVAEPVRTALRAAADTLRAAGYTVEIELTGQITLLAGDFLL